MGSLLLNEHVTSFLSELKEGDGAWWPVGLACASHVFLVHIVYTSLQKFGQHGDGGDSPPLTSLTFNILFKCCAVTHLFLLSGSYTMNILHLLIVCYYTLKSWSFFHKELCTSLSLCGRCPRRSFHAALYGSKSWFRRLQTLSDSQFFPFMNNDWMWIIMIFQKGPP